MMKNLKQMEKNILKDLKKIENWQKEEKENLERLKKNVLEEKKKSIEDLKKVLEETEIMKESLKCKLEYIENKSIELEKIELFNNAEEIRKNLDDIFDERKKEYLKFFESERKIIESENSKNKK